KSAANRHGGPDLPGSDRWRGPLELLTGCRAVSPLPKPLDECVAAGRAGAPGVIRLGAKAPTRPARPAAAQWRRPRGSGNRHTAWGSAPWHESPALLMNILLAFPYL